MRKLFAIVLAAAVCYSVAAGATILFDIQASKILVPEHDGGGAFAAIGADADGLNSVLCSNNTDNPVYITGAASVTTTHAYPICNTNCATNSIALDTYKNELKAVIASGTATSDGGTYINCIWGK